MIWYVAVGSAIGGMARYLVGSWAQRYSSYPWGTLAVNITGSFIIGWFASYALANSLRPEMRAFVAIGICGGFTTFSAFSHESMMMLRDGHWLRAGAYVAGSVILSLLAVLAGAAVGPSAGSNA